jgi:hypothetical protein
MTGIARCLCGSLSVIADGEPLAVNVCHCLDCRRRTGAAFSYNAYFLREQVRIEGMPASYEREGQEGRKVCHHFCPHCGTTVYWDFDLRPERYGIAAGLFEQPPGPPSYSAWEITRCDWAPLPTNVSHFAKNPTSPAPAQKS